MRILHYTLLWCCIGMANLQAQRTISGIITDETQLPLIGASILVKDNTHGTITDINGSYQLSLPENTHFLTVSYTGFASKEVPVGADSIINIVLRESAIFLEEIVVTGLAIGTPTTKVGFNIAKVNEEQLKQTPGVNAAIALQGKVPGLQITAASGAPGSSPSMLIRGARNLFGTNAAPLIIVDGIQLQAGGNLADVNTEDIESIEVVKGAAATSLYGSRAGNGVINIITKRGASQNGLTDITFRTEYGKSSLARQIPLAKYHSHVINSDGSIDFSKTDTDEIADNPYPQLFDQQALFFDPGNFATNTLSIGSSDRQTNYFFSLNHTKQSGTIPLLDGYTRQSVRLNIDHKINDFLKLKISNYYAQSNNDQPPSEGFGSPFFQLLILPQSVDLLSSNEEDGSPYNWDVGLTANSRFTNPLYDLYNRDATEKIQRFSGAYGIQIKPFSSLTVDANYSIDRRTIDYSLFIDKGYLADPALADGSLYRSNGNRNYQTAMGKVTYNKKITNVVFTTQGAIIYEDDTQSFFDIEAFDFRFNGIRSFDNSGLFNPGIEGNPPVNRTTRSSNDFKIKTLNYYVTGNMDWQDKLIVDGLIRWDGSSLFGANNRWNTFYRGSLAYRLTEDLWIPNVQELKIRTSYGTAGNRPRFDYRFETLTSDGSKNTLGNEDLKPSRTTEFEVGTDARVWNRLNLSINYARSLTSDLFYDIPLPAASGGFQRQWQNINSEIKTNAFEVAVGADLFKRKNAGLSANLTFDKINQQITRFDFPDFVSQFIFLVREGVAPGTIYTFQFAKSVEDLAPHQREGNNFVVNEEGWLVEADKWRTVEERPILIEDDNGNRTLGIQGNALPDFNMSVGLNGYWKGFRAYALFHWKQGGDVYNWTRQFILRDLRHGVVDQSAKPLVERKPTQYYAAFYDTNISNNYFIEDGTYLKLRELALSYQFNTTSWGKVGAIIKGAKISLIGRNLFTLTNYTGYDPEAGRLEEDLDANLNTEDGYGYPNFRTISGSVELKF